MTIGSRSRSATLRTSFMFWRDLYLKKYLATIFWGSLRTMFVIYLKYLLIRKALTMNKDGKIFVQMFTPPYCWQPPKGLNMGQRPTAPPPNSIYVAFTAVTTLLRCGGNYGTCKFNIFPLGETYRTFLACKLKFFFTMGDKVQWIVCLDSQSASWPH
jgi:hypothetical protein